MRGLELEERPFLDSDDPIRPSVSTQICRTPGLPGLLCLTLLCAAGFSRWPANGDISATAEAVQLQQPTVGGCPRICGAFVPCTPGAVKPIVPVEPLLVQWIPGGTEPGQSSWALQWQAVRTYGLEVQWQMQTFLPLGQLDSWQIKVFFPDTEDFQVFDPGNATQTLRKDYNALSNPTFEISGEVIPSPDTLVISSVNFANDTATYSNQGVRLFVLTLLRIQRKGGAGFPRWSEDGTDTLNWQANYQFLTPTTSYNTFWSVNSITAGTDLRYSVGEDLFFCKRGR